MQSFAAGVIGATRLVGRVSRGSDDHLPPSAHLSLLLSNPRRCTASQEEREGAEKEKSMHKPGKVRGRGF